MMFNFFLNFFNARDVSGNIYIGNYGIRFAEGGSGEPLAALPPLPWNPKLPTPGSDFEISNLLDWRTQLVKDLVGRRTDLESLISWACDNDQRIALRILSGAGGVGKSRLAAEVATALRQREWNTGLIALHHPESMPLPATKRGLFVVIDYPESNLDRVRTLLHKISELKTPGKIRLLLISRYPKEWWQQDIINAGANTYCDDQKCAIGPLNSKTTATLIRSAIDRLAAHRGVSAPTLTDSAIDAWHRGDPARHGLPLFATAAAIHALESPNKSLSISGTAIIEALANRERKRLEEAARNAGWTSSGRAATRLHGLAAASGGLDRPTLKDLATSCPDIGLPPADRIVDHVNQLGWWSGGRLPAPQPDLLAAELLYQVVNDTANDSPQWLAMTLNRPENFNIDRLSRLIYDMGVLHDGTPAPLITSLVAAVKKYPKCAEIWRSCLDSQATPNSMRLLAVEIGRALLKREDLTNPKRAAILNDLAIRLTDLKNLPGARNAIEKAVEIYAGLTRTDSKKFELKYAMSLSTLSSCMFKQGEKKQAIEIAHKSIEIHRRLSKDGLGRFNPHLANSLHNLAVFMNDDIENAHDATIALHACRSAVEIYTYLARKDPVRFDPNLATSLRTLSARLHRANSLPESLASIRESVKIFLRLARDNPERFEAELAASLTTMSNRLIEMGNKKKAKAAIERSIEIQTRLAKKNPAQFELSLQASQKMYEYLDN
jgi:tetratricopeptide (TPR) repeat protein